MFTTLQHITTCLQQVFACVADDFKKDTANRIGELRIVISKTLQPASPLFGVVQAFDEARKVDESFSEYLLLAEGSEKRVGSEQGEEHLRQLLRFSRAFSTTFDTVPSEMRGLVGLHKL